MNKHIKRALALSAVAPIAFIGAVGSANAAIDYAEDSEKIGNQVFSFCEHPDVPAAAFAVRLILEGDGTGADADDINRVVVTAVDNQGVGPFFNPTAHVKKMKVDYYGDFDEFDAFSGNLEPVYSESNSKKGVRDGVKWFGKEKDNVQGVRVTVKWSEIGSPGDNEVLTCFVPVRPNNNV